MELWRFLSISATVPLIVLVSGLLMRKGGPKKVNWWIGYRTPMACKNKETWVFAHIHCGKSWIIVSPVLMFLSVGVAVFAGREELTLGILMIAQIAALIISTIPTDIALRKAFDKNGERRR